ncbi:uncharacterized protein Z518_09567 [Rhinocladiella mackenziei CBS 650.93]|uniref:Rhinocladiella mackenziei CBS 650.93 unplaced genomic scaffold supercont1.7, whole genome shotgun sequence n=1 Tax=Rhinocladiella mackenziei CBS 650.93 TaxID=1442369 RepID=A0A0D2IYY1_9EURO|nr:uncharacterized protein Z518_09567 [Rhinocladiella mackenziei CBS 650.93]KIX01840.1 hypothetical protein Z518_09567 [Rhinocladiella mackenziei CBS 650.93]
MSKIAGQQSFRALCSRLRRPLLSHRPHRTLRPFSSYPNPVNLFAVGSWEKAARSGEYVDVHDLNEITDLEVNNYDVPIADLNDQKLRTEISKVLGIDYLAEAAEDDARREVGAIDGYLYGDARRPMVPCVVCNGGKPYWVHFFVRAGAPVTYLSKRVCEVLDIRKDAITTATIAGCYHQVRMSPPTSHFAEINVLGADFCDNFKFTPWFRGKGRVTYIFEDRCDKVKKLFER